MACKLKLLLCIFALVLSGCVGNKGAYMLGKALLPEQGTIELDLIPQMSKQGKVVPIEVYLTPVNPEKFNAERAYLEKMEQENLLLKKCSFEFTFQWGDIIRHEMVEHQGGYLRPMAILIDSFVFESRIVNSEGKMIIKINELDKDLEQRIGPFMIEVMFYSGK